MARKLAKVDLPTCVACGCCVKACPRDAVAIFHGVYAQIATDKCVGCGLCAKACPAESIILISREVAS